jgi:hypothetical protein
MQKAANHHMKKASFKCFLHNKFTLIYGFIWNPNFGWSKIVMVKKKDKNIYLLSVREILTSVFELKFCSAWWSDFPESLTW